MRPPALPSVAALALLAALQPGSSFASSVEEVSRAVNIQQGNDLANVTAALVPASDCAFVASHADPDGRERRASVSRVTRAFAVSHPAGVSSPGLTGVVSHVRPVLLNYIDEEIFGAMSAAKVTPAPPSSDAEFLRRATLDLTGRIPDPGAVTAFLADPAPDKRSRMVDTLLASDAFVDRWTFYYDELFQNTAFASSGRIFPAGRNVWHAYFQDAVRSRKPWDTMARELIGAVGDTMVVGPADFLARGIQTNGPGQDTLDNLAASTGTIFLGEGAVFCTSCHNGAGHLDSINLWGSTVKRQDFWGVSAFYSRVALARTVNCVLGSVMTQCNHSRPTRPRRWPRGPSSL